MLHHRTIDRLVAAGTARPAGLRPQARAAALVVLVVFVCCLLAPWLAPQGPLRQTGQIGGPSTAHPFGLDQQTRDIFVRLLYGGRWSLLIGLAATGIALVGGAVLGALAATAGRVGDEITMRLLDIVMAFPGIALAAVLVTISPREARIPVLIVAIAVVYIPGVARVVRANVLAQYGEDYVAAEQVMGASRLWIVARHVAVNCAAPVLVFCTLLVADAIVFEAGLSFIGAGMPEEQPSWGSVMAGGKNMAQIGQWWGSLFPGLLILLIVVMLNVLAEGITDALANPRLRIPRAAGAPSVVGTVPGARPGDDGAALATPENDPMPAHDRGVEDQLVWDLARLAAVERARDDRPPPPPAAPHLLQVTDLQVRFPTEHGDVAVVDQVGFSIGPGQIMGLVGESGCGKSLTSLAVMGLLPRTAQVTGSIDLAGEGDLLTMDPRRRHRLRGREMAMIHQDALSALNPAMQIRRQLDQLLARGGTRSAVQLLELVGLDPRRTLRSYPHELSGGQRQRVLIAMALTQNPRLVVADEPTTALDVTVQQQVIDLLTGLRDELGFAMLFVSHDLALVASVAHEVTIMYAGQVVEQGPTPAVLTDPQHAYTRGLLGSVLSIEDGGHRLHQIPGTVPAPRDFGTGDRFGPRRRPPAPDDGPRPVLIDLGGGHLCASQPEDR